jgi:hypothetical protein
VASSVLGCYALSSFAAGYKSGGYYKQFFHPRPAPNWIKTMGLTLLLFPLGCCSVGFLLNSVALLKGTMNAVPFGTLVKVFLIWLVVAVPLGVAGTIAGRRWSGKSNFPCRVGAVMRPIPPPRWYSTPLFLIAATGVLPFFRCVGAALALPLPPPAAAAAAAAAARVRNNAAPRRCCVCGAQNGYTPSPTRCQGAARRSRLRSRSRSCS